MPDGFAPAELVPYEYSVPSSFFGLGGQLRDIRWLGQLIEEREPETRTHDARNVPSIGNEPSTGFVLVHSLEPEPGEPFTKSRVD